MPEKIIDLDSHWWEPFTWLEETAPSLQRELDERLPASSLADVAFGEVIAELPAEQRDQFLDLLPLRFGRGDGESLSPSEMERRLPETPLGAIMLQPGSRDTGERLEWIDGRGIDMQFVNPTLPLGTLQQLRRHAPDRQADFCRAYNDWTSEMLHGHTDRLAPTSLVVFDDPAATVAELERMRARGSRAFLMPLFPAGGRSIAHVDNEVIWAAAVDLGVVPILHVALGSVLFDPAWCNTGRPDAAANAARLAMSQNATIPQIPLAALILNGVFERHPGLRVVCSEFGLSWVAGWLDKLGPTDRRGTPNLTSLLGWSLARSVEETVREHVVFTPLKHQSVEEVVSLLGPQSVSFATDYPHPEGSPDAAALFESELCELLDEPELDAFYSGTARTLLV